MESIIEEKEERRVLIQSLLDKYPQPYFSEENDLTDAEFGALVPTQAQRDQFKADFDTKVRSLVDFVPQPIQRPPDLSPELFAVKSFYDAVAWYAIPVLGRKDRLTTAETVQMVVDALPRVDWKSYRSQVASLLADTNPALSEVVGKFTLPQFQTYVQEMREKSVTNYTFHILSALFNVTFWIKHANSNVISYFDETGTRDNFIAFVQADDTLASALFYAKQVLSNPLPPQIAANYSLIFTPAQLPSNLRETVVQPPLPIYKNPFEGESES